MLKKDIVTFKEPWELVHRVADYVRAGSTPYMITAEQFGAAVGALVANFGERDAFEMFLRGFNAVRSRVEPGRRNPQLR